jgi:hypothetical protein
MARRRRLQSPWSVEVTQEADEDWGVKPSVGLASLARARQPKRAPSAPSAAPPKAPRCEAIAELFFRATRIALELLRAMEKKRSRYQSLGWRLARERIGQLVRGYYRVEQQMSPRLAALVKKIENGSAELPAKESA